MKNLNQLLFIATLLVMCSCSEYVIVPQYASVEKLNSLTSGMSKEEVSQNLSVAPYEAYHSTENGCELYGYKYLHKFQEINPKNKHNSGALKGNPPRYDDESDAFLYFENGKLKDLIVANAKVDHEFVDEMIASCNGPVSGCTDSRALNYNPDAIINNGSCEFCPCDYYKNPNYDSNKECEEQCIPVDNGDADNDGDGNGNGDEAEDCSLCDIVSAANGNVNINIKSSLDSSSNTNNSKRNNKKNIDVDLDSNKNNSGKNSKESSKKSKVEKQIKKLEEKLEKSKESDSKKGVTSKKTQLLEAAIEKLQNQL
tara:strand:+ start:22216 stop:23151 length:936 start_codon:yes stop_codon:yes gene_type:complete